MSRLFDTVDLLYSIVGFSIPQRWIVGGTVEARLPLHLSVEADILYHELRFKEGIQFGQTPLDWRRALKQHVVTWDIPSC